MRIALALGLLPAILLIEAATADAPASADPVVKEWKVEWGGRPRDPYVAPDGKVWFVGQAGNYIARFDPATQEFRRYEIEDGTNPHNLIVDEDGFVWYAGNRNGRIGKLDPATGKAKTFMTGEARDPHTMVFDGKGHIWFTSQQSNRVGRLAMATGNYELVTPDESAARPYGIVIDNKGNPWVSLFSTSHVIRVDPKTLKVIPYSKATPESRSRRIEVTGDGSVWYVDEPRGFLGRIDPANGEVKEFAMPGGAGSRPYALTRDGKDRLWISQTGPDKKLVAFDPRTERFVSVNDVSHTIRHMMYDDATGAMWFGTDANQIGRILTGRAAN
ncbi:MAG: virginiamycin B lyase family protein [Steroidobacteraceae bacterium]